MNDLRVFCRPDADSDELFHVAWMTGLTRKGVLTVRVRAQGDRKTIAELVALRRLLEVGNVCGHDKAGAGLRIWVSCGAIKKLLRGNSAKSDLAPYANFLRTRFAGCEVRLQNRQEDWAEMAEEGPVERAEVEAGPPEMTLIEVGGFGQVELTVHAIEQFVARFDCHPTKAWRTLCLLARDAYPVGLPSPSFSVGKHKGRTLGYAKNDRRQVLMVITEASDKGRRPALATLYSAVPQTFG